MLAEGSRNHIELTDCMARILREYQKEGFYWLKSMYKCGFGGILADDMGLGKTLQAISMILSERKNTACPDLVVAPTSLVYNWEKEMDKFAPELKSVVVSGAPNKRKALLENNQPDVFITTCEMLKRDFDCYKNIQFHIIFVDEAQNIKNPVTKNAKVLKMLKADCRFALTGTPIENSLFELWSIFDFIMPGYLYNYAKFAKNYEQPIIKDNNAAVAERLKMQVSPFILRRIKKDVLSELPPKTETIIYADMTQEQRKIYTAYFLQAKGKLGFNEGDFNAISSRIDILSQLTRLRQICCHPALFMEEYAGGSGKLDAVLETGFNAIKAGHRILIFSQLHLC